MFVIVAPRSVDGALLQRVAAAFEQHSPPADVVGRRAEVDALVAREADRASRENERDDVGRAEQSADHVVAPPDALR
jgi:hypothetical protein